MGNVQAGRSIHVALRDHFQQTHLPERFYSLPAAARTSMVRISDYFGDVSTHDSSYILQGADVPALNDLNAMQVVAAPDWPDPVASDEVYFQVGMMEVELSIGEYSK